MPKDKVRELALKAGFVLKEQEDGSMDLHPYVYTFVKYIIHEVETTYYSAREHETW